MQVNDFLITRRKRGREERRGHFNGITCPNVTVDKSVCEIEGSKDEKESEDNKGDICQLLKPMDGISAQRQVLRALTLEV